RPSFRLMIRRVVQGASPIGARRSRLGSSPLQKVIDQNLGAHEYAFSKYFTCGRGPSSLPALHDTIPALGNSVSCIATRQFSSCTTEEASRSAEFRVWNGAKLRCRDLRH